MREVVPELTDIKTSLKTKSSLSRAQTCRLLFTWRIMQRCGGPEGYVYMYLISTYFTPEFLLECFCSYFNSLLE